MSGEQIASQLEEVLEMVPGTLREDEEVRNLEHWDSLKLLEIISLADEQFQVQLDADQLARCITVGDIVRLIRASDVAGDSLQ